MTPEMNLAAIALLTFLLVAAYFMGFDEGRDVEMRRNQKRRAHHHRTTTNHERPQP